MDSFVPCCQKLRAKGGPLASKILKLLYCILYISVYSNILHLLNRHIMPTYCMLHDISPCVLSTVPPLIADSCGLRPPPLLPAPWLRDRPRGKHRVFSTRGSKSLGNSNPSPGWSTRIGGCCSYRMPWPKKQKKTRSQSGKYDPLWKIHMP